jgi:hypothetical protein
MCNHSPGPAPQGPGFSGDHRGTPPALPFVMDTSPRPTTKQPRRYRDRAWYALAVIFAVALAAAFIWSSGAERRAIERMDPTERRLVYENAFGELRRLCGAGPRDDALEKRCVAQVEFILQFPECDARCQEIARSHFPRPTK